LKKDYLIIIPVFNEEQTIQKVATMTLNLVENFADILFVNDGSTDRTSLILNELEHNYDSIKIINKIENQGYGASLSCGFEYGIKHNYAFWITMDCDEQHQPKDIIRFKEEPESLELVSGSRYHPDSGIQGIPAPEDRVEINRRITNLINKQYALEITDAFCGFKRYKAEAFQNHEFTVKGYASPMELWAFTKSKNLSFKELPVDKIYVTDDRSFGEDLDKKRKRYQYYLKTWRKSHQRFFQTKLFSGFIN
jgi:glycosyltransferase involved in cell wall biosynthesis